MSSLLEEAIVDAKALKEAALKNAENAVLEKYSTEVKGALATLLEQEEDATPVEEGDEDLMEFVDDVPFAFQNEELDAPEQGEIVEIDFDALKQRIAEEDEIVESDDLIDATELAEEIVDEAAGSDYMTQDEDDAEEAAAVAASGGGTAGMPLDEDEDIAFTEEMLAELVEELVVYMRAVPQGWASVNSANNSIEQANNDAMAAAQAAHLEEEEIEEEVATAPDVVSDAGLY